MPARTKQNGTVLVVLLSLLISLCFPAVLFAQSPPPAATITPAAAPRANNVAGAATLGVARMIAIKDKTVKNGHILSSTDKGAILSSLSYDPQVIGVVSRDAAIILNSTGESGVPVISVGTVYILVSAKDGPIKKGDLITTSTIPGVAVKALKSGYVLGTALEDYTSNNPKQADLIAAELNLHYFNSKSTLAGTLSDILKIALLPTKDSPTPIFKYIVAAIVVLGSFVLGFVSFGRTAAKGVEALGRNPAASRIIHLGIIFNVGIVVVIVFAGLTVAFLILRL
jgi:F0F1-type ATP synthase membrane subunit c/vacuolar-type H+-ATPase subunit K